MGRSGGGLRPLRERGEDRKFGLSLGVRGGKTGPIQGDEDEGRRGGSPANRSDAGVGL